MIVVILVLILALAYVIKSSMRSGSAQAQPKWFYCLTTQQLYGADIKSIPPVESPWGGEGVEAIVYFCDDDCKGEPQIARLIKFTPEIKSVLEQYTRGKIDSKSLPPVMEQMAGRLLSDPDNIEWFSSISPQGSKLVAASLDCGDDEQPNSNCYPPKVTESESGGG